MKKVYVASSWRNEHQPAVVDVLRGLGLNVYDFRNPQEGIARAREAGRGRGTGFQWPEIDPEWQSWTPEQFRASLQHSRAVEAFQADRVACEGADATLLVLPCGRSSHLELGVAVGRGAWVAVFFPPGIPRQEPELMYRWVDVLTSWKEVERWGRSLGK